MYQRQSKLRRPKSKRHERIEKSLHLSRQDPKMMKLSLLKSIICYLAIRKLPAKLRSCALSLKKTTTQISTSTLSTQSPAWEHATIRSMSATTAGPRWSRAKSSPPSPLLPRWLLVSWEWKCTSSSKDSTPSKNLGIPSSIWPFLFSCLVSLTISRRTRAKITTP